MEKNLYQTSLKMVYFIQLELKMFQKFYQIFTYQKRNFKNKEEGMELEKKEEINKTIIL